jgi:hypothetical protein
MDNRKIKVAIASAGKVRKIIERMIPNTPTAPHAIFEQRSLEYSGLL